MTYVLILGDRLTTRKVVGPFTDETETDVYMDNHSLKGAPPGTNWQRWAVEPPER